jgi:hypothetical protein
MSDKRENLSRGSRNVRVLMWPAKSPNPLIPLLIENLRAQYQVLHFNFQNCALWAIRDSSRPLARDPGTKQTGSKAAWKTVFARLPDMGEYSEARTSRLDGTQ